MNKLIDFDTIIQNLLSIPRSKNDTGQALLAYIKNLCEKEGYEYNEVEFANLLIIKEASEEFLDIEPIFLHAQASYEYEEYRVLEANKSEYMIDYYKKSNKFLSDTMSIGSNAHQGIAMIIAILTNKDLKHPKLEIIISSNNKSIEPSISKFDVN